MIRSVICDVGEMLLHYRWQMVLERLSRLSGREPEDVLNILRGTPHEKGSLVYEHDLGTINTAQFISGLRDRLKIGSEVSDERLGWVFENCFEFSGETRRLLHYLAGICTLGVISNMNPLQWKHIIRTFPTLHPDSGVFSFYVLSYEESLMKPDARIYELAFLRARLAAGEKFGEEILPQECVFLDDRLENLEAAGVFGMQTVLVNKASYSDISGGLYALGVQPPPDNFNPDPTSHPDKPSGQFHLPSE